MFIETTRPHGVVWQHETKPHWITYYPTTKARTDFYQAYRAIAPVPKGRKPWTVDNRRIGSEDGFPTLEIAMLAAS